MDHKEYNALVNDMLIRLEPYFAKSRIGAIDAYGLVLANFPGSLYTREGWANSTLFDNKISWLRDGPGTGLECDARAIMRLSDEDLERRILEPKSDLEVFADQISKDSGCDGQ